MLERLLCCSQSAFTHLGSKERIFSTLPFFKKKNLFIYFKNMYYLFLFIWLHQVLTVAHGTFRRDMHTSPVVASGLWSICTGTIITARRFSCSSVCGILVPQPGIEPTFLAVQGRFLTTGPPGSLPEWIFEDQLTLFVKYFT